MDAAAKERRTLADGNKRVVVRRGRGGAAGSDRLLTPHDKTASTLDGFILSPPSVRETRIYPAYAS